MNALKKLSTWTLVLIILILGISFTLLNPEFIALNLGFKVISLPLALLILLVFATGLLLGLIAGFTRAFFLHRKKERAQIALKLNL